MDGGGSRNRRSVGALAAAALTPTPIPTATVEPRELEVSGPPDSDRDAVAAVYREHHPFVWRSLARLGVRDDRLPDAAHDVFMVVARRLIEFEGRSSIRTWLFAICMRVARATRRDFAREQRRREKYRAMNDDGGARPHARADAARTLRDLLQRLDEDKRVVFIMAALEEMTAPEIATVLSIKPATVYSRLRLARAELDRMVARQRVRERREG